MERAPTRSFISRGISADNGQGMGLPVACQMFECQTWEDGQPVAPKLVLTADDLLACPSCGMSYGIAGES